MNLVQGTVDADGIRIGSTVIPLDGRLPKPVGEAVTVGLRPESLALASAGNGIPATVSIVEELGAEAFVYAHLVDSATAGLNVQRGNHRSPGAACRAAQWRTDPFGRQGQSMLFFDADTGLAIGT